MGNKYKLQKSASHNYNLRKFSFCSRVVNIWNSLPDSVVNADTLNTFKSRLDKHWLDQDVLYNFARWNTAVNTFVALAHVCCIVLLPRLAIT